MSCYCVCVVWVHVMTDPTVEMGLLGLFQERQHFKFLERVYDLLLVCCDRI